MASNIIRRPLPSHITRSLHVSYIAAPEFTNNKNSNCSSSHYKHIYTVATRLPAHHRTYMSAMSGWVNSRKQESEYSRRVNRAHLFVFVPHAEQWIVERFGKYKRTLDSGFHVVVPFIDRIAYKHMLKEQAFSISDQTAITKDNVQINIGGMLYFKIEDPYKASYEIENPLEAITNLAQTTMRAEIGRITLDKTFSERQSLNASIVEEISKSCSIWGISVQRYEIKDISVPPQIRIAMELEAEAERKKRQTILNSEAERQSAENIAFGKKRATELMSEADMIEQMNLAKGDAFAIQAKADATAKAIQTIADAISMPNGEHAVAYRVAQEWIQAFARLAQQTNTMILPANASDASAMTAQAIAIYDNIVNKQKKHSSDMTKDRALSQVLGELGLTPQGQAQQQPPSPPQQERQSFNVSGNEKLE